MNEIKYNALGEPIQKYYCTYCGTERETKESHTCIYCGKFLKAIEQPKRTLEETMNEFKSQNEILDEILSKRLIRDIMQPLNKKSFNLKRILWLVISLITIGLMVPILLSIDISMFVFIFLSIMVLIPILYLYIPTKKEDK